MELKLWNHWTTHSKLQWPSCGWKAMVLVVYGGNIDCIQHVVEVTNMILQLIYDDACIYLLLTCLSFANPPSIMMSKVCL